MVDKNSTGPKLQGAKQKWMDAGEGDLIYDWITNSSALIASGKSARAKEVSGYSPTAMPPQTVSKEEIDAILTFVDAPPVVTTTPSDTTATATVGGETKPDYVANLSMFNWMIFLMVILILIIIVLAGSIMTYVKSDYFKTKVAEMGDQSKLLIIVITTGSLFVSNDTHALNFMQAGEAEKGMPWLQVDNTDLYALLVVNIILLIVILYLRNLFYQMVAMVRPKKEEVETVPVVGETLKKVNAILTDAVPIEEEHTILMDHEYDGIRELDNNLPPWWVWGFFATIVFAFIYIINYHGFRHL
jgi:cytochrome c oxidase cbb3-type subunit 3